MTVVVSFRYGDTQGLTKLSPEDAEDAVMFIGNIAEDLSSVRDSIDALERLIPQFAHLMPSLRIKLAPIVAEVGALCALAKAGMAPREEG